MNFLKFFFSYFKCITKKQTNKRKNILELSNKDFKITRISIHEINYVVRILEDNYKG